MSEKNLEIQEIEIDENKTSEQEFDLAIYYSPSMNGFFRNDFNPEIPDDAIEITEQEHNELLIGQSTGKVISTENGKVILIDPPEIPLDQKWELVRTKRGELLASSDWTQLGDSPLGTAKKAEWKSYRQALREITDQPNPDNLQWPVIPT